ncbi:hypothetical protein D3C81_356900 [compost metagenome]
MVVDRVRKRPPGPLFPPEQDGYVHSAVLLAGLCFDESGHLALEIFIVMCSFAAYVQPFPNHDSMNRRGVAVIRF